MVATDVVRGQAPLTFANFSYAPTVDCGQEACPRIAPQAQNVGLGLRRERFKFASLPMHYWQVYFCVASAGAIVPTSVADIGAPRHEVLAAPLAGSWDICYVTASAPY